MPPTVLHSNIGIFAIGAFIKVAHYAQGVFGERTLCLLFICYYSAFTFDVQGMFGTYT